MGKSTLGLIAHILNGFAFSSSKFSKSGEGMPLIRIRDIGYNRSDYYILVHTIPNTLLNLVIY